MKSSIIALIVFCFILKLEAQNKKFQINGAARSYLFSNELKIDQALDSITPKKSNYGHNVLDLGISVFPNSTTEVISMFRIRNELGGFWGGGVTFNVRQLTLKGVVKNIVRYELGDIDLKMTSYTLFNTREEGITNEAEIFAIRRKVFHYDLFYNDNFWRMQGAKVDFNLLPDRVFKKISFKSYLTRQRATDGLTKPERLYGGGSINFIKNKKLNIQVNSYNMFDLSQTAIIDSSRFTNSVFTSNFNYKIRNREKIALKLFGEAGISNSKYLNYTNSDAPSLKSDWFYDIASSTYFKKKKFRLEIGAKDVGKNFRSPGAQTKRINYSKYPGLYQQFTNEYIGREVSFSDVINGNAEASFKISETLMSYNAAYSNTNPYGDATPNRRGFYVNLEWLDSIKIKNTFVNFLFLQESVGTGTLKRKNFILSRIGTDIWINEYFNWKKILKINFGMQNEFTFREGETYEEINLSSHFIDAGLSYEFVPKLSFLLGCKFWIAKGNEHLIIRDDFNTVIDFNMIDINFSESIIAAGIKYDFEDKNTLTIQYQSFNLKNRSVNGIDYGISEFIILYSLFF